MFSLFVHNVLHPARTSHHMEGVACCSNFSRFICVCLTPNTVFCHL